MLCTAVPAAVVVTCEKNHNAKWIESSDEGTSYCVMCLVETLQEQLAAVEKERDLLRTGYLSLVEIVSRFKAAFGKTLQANKLLDIMESPEDRMKQGK